MSARSVEQKQRAVKTRGQSRVQKLCATFMQADLFQAQVPAFQFKDSGQVSSIFGLVFSLCIFLVMLVYASVKFNQLMTYHNPNLAQIDKPGAMDEAENFNFREAGLQFAFTVEGMYSR